MNWKRRIVFKVWLSFLCLKVSFSEDTSSSSDSIDGDGSELPGHMQPLGSHRPPLMIKRIQHLPTPAEFVRDYVTPKVPVVMEGALNGASVWKKWQNDDYLREVAGEEIVGVEQGKKENRSDSRYTLTVKEFLNKYQTEDIYMVSDMPPPLYKEWELPRPMLCEKLLDRVMITNIWLSSGGTNSVLHTDSYENFHCLVSGVKRFTMFEPQYNETIGPEYTKGFYDVDVEKVDMTKYPELSRIPWYLAEIKEGDCLYLPILWIHNVKSFSHNFGTNIWWSRHDFTELDCPSDEKMPEYKPLGSVVEPFHEMELVMEMIQVAVVNDVLDADHFYAVFSEVGLVRSLDSVKQFFEHLQPGCNGIIEDFSIPRRNYKNAFDFMMKNEWDFSIFEDLIRQAELERYEGYTSTEEESNDEAATDVDSHDEL